MASLFSALKVDKKELDTYILLLSAPLLLTLYRYHGFPEYFTFYFPGAADLPLLDLYSRLWQFAVFFVLAFIVPVLVVTLRFKRPLTDFGLGLGDLRYGLTSTALLSILVVLPLACLGSTLPDVRQEYPLAKILLHRHDLIPCYHLAYILLYYIAWEFFFRGFLLFGLKDRFGPAPAVLIQTISSCLIHIGKPEGEILGSIVAGIIFGAIALRTRSIWYVFVLHALMGVLTDLFIIYGG